MFHIFGYLIHSGLNKTEIVINLINKKFKRDDLVRKWEYGILHLINLNEFLIF